MGAWTADYDTVGSRNALVGSLVARHLTGAGNTIMGFNAGSPLTIGSGNVMIGQYAGGGLVNGNGNIFIGRYAGAWETRSNKLYIENAVVDSTGALIYGDFASNRLRFNGKIGIIFIIYAHVFYVLGNYSYSYLFYAFHIP